LLIKLIMNLLMMLGIWCMVTYC